MKDSIFEAPRTGGLTMEEIMKLLDKRLLRCAVSYAVLFAAVGVPASALGQSARTQTDPETFQYRDLSAELANKMTGNYTIAVVGDVLMQEPMGLRMSPDLVDVLQSADTTIGNAEVYLVERQFWAGPVGYGNNWGPSEVAEDWARLGFDLMGAGEAAGGEEGMQSTLRIMDEAGIKIAGYGPNMTIARTPVFQELEQGRVAMVYALPIGPVADGPTARDKTGNSGGEEWGLNTLRLTQNVTVTQEQLDQLRAIRDSIVDRRDEDDVARPIDVPGDEEDRVQLLDRTYILGDAPGEFQYEMNRSDENAQILAVRGAKQYADYAIFSMHIHENRYAFQAYSQDHYPPDYVVELARDMVDNGLDLFHGHGNHTMQGIEIYKGRPIFYNLGNLSVHRFGAGSNDGRPATGAMTYIEAGELGEHWLQGDINLMAYAAEVDYADGIATQVRIHPVDLGIGKDRPWSRMNIPMTPSPERAQMILELIQEYSEPFGTEIRIEDGIGYIDIDPEETVPVGEGIRDTF